MEECAALCERCEEATTGKIYSPYICTNCKIKELEQTIAEYKMNQEELHKYKAWYQKESDEASELRKYKFAFEMLVKELAKFK